MKRKSLFLTLLLLLLFCFPAGMRAKAQEADTYGDDAYYYMEYLQTNYPERAVAYPNLEYAAEWLKGRVAEMGYEYAAQPFSVVSGENTINGENIIFSKPGESSRVIVVGAHYDSVLTNGADDNASGVGLLLETANRLSAGAAPPYTVRFILFSAEEPGCIGSQYYVDSLSEEERQNILCMINIDTIGAGDNMYLYGGGVDDSGQVVRTWLVEQAMDAALNMGLAMSYHPDVNPEFPVPAKQTASDQQAFDRAGIPYLYLEASNWNGGPYTNFYQTSDPTVENGKMMHVQAYDNLAFYTQTFGGRIYEHMKAYSKLVSYLLYNMIPDTGAVQYEFEERDETVRAVSDVRIRANASLAAAALDVLKEGETIRRTGYHEEWSRVDYGSGEAYIKTEYLTVDEPVSKEAAAEESTAEESTPEESTPEKSMTEGASEDETEETSGTTQSTEKQDGAGEGENGGMKVITQSLEEPQENGGVFSAALNRLESSSALRCIVIVSIILVAVLLCVFVFMLQHRKDRK